MSVKDTIREAMEGIIQAKAQVAENLTLNVTIHIGDTYIRPNFPKSADPRVLISVDPSSDVKNSIIESTVKRLPDNVASLPAKEKYQLIADSTAASLIDEFEKLKK